LKKHISLLEFGNIWENLGCTHSLLLFFFLGHLSFLCFLSLSLCFYIAQASLYNRILRDNNKNIRALLDGIGVIGWVDEKTYQTCFWCLLPV
jgi:hypothetical protein